MGFAIRKQTERVLLAVVGMLLLFLVLPAIAQARTVYPPPPWSPSNGSDIIARAHSAVGTWYTWGYESWVAQSGSGAGPDCSGLVIKSWEVPGTLYYFEEDTEPRGPNVNFAGRRYTTYDLWQSGPYWESVLFPNRARADCAVNKGKTHAVLIHDKDYYGSGLDRVYEAPAPGSQIRHGLKNINDWYVTRRDYLEFYPTGTLLVDNPSAGQSGPDSVTGWRASTSNTPYYGDNYQFVYCNETAHARWVPFFGTSGYYRVEVRYSTAPSRTAKAVYEIHGDLGTSYVMVDQRQNDGVGGWKSLGVYHFAAGYNKYSGAVDLYSPTGEGPSRNIVIDAVRFVKL